MCDQWCADTSHDIIDAECATWFVDHDDPSAVVALSVPAVQRQIAGSQHRKDLVRDAREGGRDPRAPGIDDDGHGQGIETACAAGPPVCIAGVEGGIASGDEGAGFGNVRWWGGGHLLRDSRACVGAGAEQSRLVAVEVDDHGIGSLGKCGRADADPRAAFG